MDGKVHRSKRPGLPRREASADRLEFFLDNGLFQGGDADLGRRGFLAGISDLVAVRQAVPGDVLDVDVTVAGRFGGSVKLDGRISDAAGAEIARGSIVVRHGSAA